MSIVERALAKRHRSSSEAAPARVAETTPPGSSKPPAKFAVLDEARLTQVGLRPPANMVRQLAEEFRVVKRPLLRNAFAEHEGRVPDGNLLMVGSAFSGAGKTFTALNLALSVAVELDHSVLLVDADIIKQTLSKELGLHGAPGLIDLLLDSKMDVADVTAATDRECLSFLPAGRHHPLANELLASHRMHELVGIMGGQDRNRLVLFDGPPILETTEARVLANHMGQLLLVVAAGETSQHSLAQVLETLDLSKAINLVLNKSERSLVSSSYGGDYHQWQYGKPVE